MNAIVPFQFGDHPVRISDRDGQPWFVLADMCRVLGLANVSDAAKRLDPDERDDIALTDAIGREQMTAVINEPGLYRLIFRSRKEAAQRFSKWVTTDVLPAIRRTGSYGAPAAHIDLRNRATLQMLLRDLTGVTIAADARIAELEPQAAALARLTDAEGALCVTDAAKALGVQPKRLFAWPERNGWIYRRAGGSRWIGYQAKVAAGLIEHKMSRIRVQHGSDKMREQALITPKGLARLAEFGTGR